MVDSLHRTSDGRLISGARPRLEAELDPGPWGQTRPIVYNPAVDGGPSDPQSVIKGEVYITSESGEPVLRTFTLSVLPRTQQPPDVSAIPGREQEADVHVVCRFSYGVGGAGSIAEVSVKRGTSFTCPASAWDVACFIEPMPDMSQAWGSPLEFYPNAFTGHKTVTVYCSAALGSRQGGATLPTRDVFYRTEPLLAAPQAESFPIPVSAVSLTFLAHDGPASAALQNGHWLGPNGSEIGLLDFAVGAVNNVPASATAIYFEVQSLQPSRLITMAWGIFL